MLESREGTYPICKSYTGSNEWKLWAGERVVIPAGSARLVKVRTEGGWKGEGVVESIPPEEQEVQELVLSENAYNATGSVQAIYMENHTEEEVELCIEQKVRYESQFVYG